MGEYHFARSGLICLQQTVSGTGVHDGTRLGYAGYSYNAGGVLFDVRYRFLGTEGNAYKIALLTPSAPSPTTYARLDPAGKVLNVILKTTAGAISATAAEVCDAINALPQTAISGPVFQAAVVTGGTISVALTATSLTGGLDPDVTAGADFPKITPVANTSGGLFYFDQDRPWEVVGIGGQFSAGVTVVVTPYNVTRALRLGSIAGPAQSIVVAGSPFRMGQLPLKVTLVPGQGLVVAAPGVTGTVEVSAKALPL